MKTFILDKVLAVYTSDLDEPLFVISQSDSLLNGALHRRELGRAGTNVTHANHVKPTDTD